MAAAVPHTAHARASAASLTTAKDSPAHETAASFRTPRETSHAEAASGAAEPAADADALLKQARDAWLHQQCPSAIEIARRALKAKPSLTDAYQIITVCSCSLKDARAPEGVRKAGRQEPNAGAVAVSEERDLAGRGVGEGARGRALSFRSPCSSFRRPRRVR